MTTNTSLISVGDLDFHPRLESFPMLSAEAFNAMIDSVVDNGIQQPLLITPIPENKLEDIEDNPKRPLYWVYDGRNRLNVAMRLEKFDKVPCVIRPIAEEAVLAFALESAVIGRQLTKSAIALIIFEQHPELAAQRGKKGRPKLNRQIAELSEDEGQVTFTKLAERYKINPKEFYYLAEIRSKATDTEWDGIRFAILNEETPVSRLFAGFSTGQKPNSKRAAINWLSFSDDGFDGVMARPLKSLVHAFSGDGLKAYQALPIALKGVYAKAVTDTLATLPEDLQAEIRRLL